MARYKTTREEHYASVRELAKKSFEKHVLRDANVNYIPAEDQFGIRGPRWLLRRPNDGSFWVEIVCLAGRKLLVHGDIDATIFAYGSGKGLERVRWMAQAGLDYLVEKATIGAGGDRPVEYIASLAKKDLAEMIEDDGDGFDLVDIDTIDFDSQDVLLTQLGDARVDLDGMYDLGEVVETQIFFAQAACQRLVELLGS